MHKHLAPALALLLPFAALPLLARAQDECPKTATCYAGHELELSPADGPVQFLVVETTVKTSTTLDGQTTSETATLVEFASDGDRYVQRGDPLPPYPKVGILKTADVGDTFSLREVAQ